MIKRLLSYFIDKEQNKPNLLDELPQNAEVVCIGGSYSSPPVAIKIAKDVDSPTVVLVGGTDIEKEYIQEYSYTPFQFEEDLSNLRTDQPIVLVASRVTMLRFYLLFKLYGFKEVYRVRTGLVRLDKQAILNEAREIYDQLKRKKKWEIVKET